jgi:DNA-binding transcriptional MerR regulator
MPDRRLSPAEVCKLIGLSPKALRLYERLKLVQPERTAAGWRVFGPEAVERLYQIKVLKGFGLSLERIGRIVDGDAAGASRLADVLTLQAEALNQEQARVAAAIALVGQALSRIATGATLTAADLRRLDLEARAAPDEDLADRLRPYVERHFGPEDYRRVKRAISDQWATLIAEAASLQRAGADPASAAARDLLERWRTLTRVFTGGDVEVERKSAAAFAEAMEDPTAGPPPIDPEVWTFLLAVGRGMPKENEP